MEGQAIEEPFGQPDGAKVNFSDRHGGFIPFDDPIRWGSLATREDDLRARFLIGRKGSGKTVYLRRIEAHAALQKELFSVAQDSNPVCTADVIDFCQRFAAAYVTEAWQDIWRWAILRSVTGVVLFTTSLSQKLMPKELEQLKDASQIAGLPEIRTPLSIYNNLRVLIQSCNTESQTRNMLRNHRWLDLETLLKLHIGRLPPLCFYLDSVDDEFQHAPIYWMRCQKGLFYAVMRLLRDPVFGGRLHVFVCLRDIVLTSIRESEHMTRYEEHEYIRRLDWNLDAAKFFLHQKLSLLHERWLAAPKSSGQLVERWTGFETIHNEERDVDEGVEQYILRHTRLLPRDIIVVGNAICNAIAKGRLNLDRSDRQKQFRDIISECAALFGHEQLLICCNQISSDQTPPKAGQYGITEIYTTMKEYQSTISDRLRELLERIGTDKFSAEEVESQRAHLHDDFQSCDPFNAMWQNGMIGCLKKVEGRDRVQFYSASHAHDLRLPEWREGYVFHPSLLDAFSIKPVGSVPIIPYEE